MSNNKRIKVAFLTLFLVVSVAALLTAKNTVGNVQAFAEGPNAGVTGAPGELTCAMSGCHSGAPNTGPGLLEIEAPTFYRPGQTYEVTVRHVTSDVSRRRWGFQLTALDGTNNRAGSLENTSALTQVIEGGPDGTRQYIEHSFLGTFQGQSLPPSWTFNWIAPSSNIGPVTFYAAGNQANNNGTESGDQIYSTSILVRSGNLITGPPVILDAAVSKKQLLVMGENFDIEALLFMDGGRQKKTFNDELTPNTLLVARKAGKNIAPGQTVILQVKNPDGTPSNEFSFTRPL